MGSQLAENLETPAGRVAVNLADRVPDGTTVLIDTNPIIYLLEGNPLGAAFHPLFESIDKGRIRAIVTPITLAEVISGPLKSGNEALVERYRRVITQNAGWSMSDIDADVAVLSARLRLRYGLRLPDALQLAVALHTGCYALATHDRDFGAVSEVLILGSSRRPR